MAENSSKSMFEMLWDLCQEWSEKSESTILKNILGWLAKLLKWELNETQTETQEKLDEIANDLITKQFDLTDKEVSDTEREFLEKIAQLDSSDKKIQNWFTRLSEIDNEDFVSQEKEKILKKLQTEANDEWSTEEWDLKEDEFNNIAAFIKKKNELCESVLKSEDEKFKALPDNLKTKKEIVDSCNRVLGDKDRDLNNITNDFENLKTKIIEDLESKKTE